MRAVLVLVFFTASACSMDEPEVELDAEVVAGSPGTCMYQCQWWGLNPIGSYLWVRLPGYDRCTKNTQCVAPAEDCGKSNHTEKAYPACE